MERYELTLLIETTTYLETTLNRADERERGLTHGQKHYLIQSALIILRDTKDDLERQRRALDTPDRTDQIPF